MALLCTTATNARRIDVPARTFLFCYYKATMGDKRKPYIALTGKAACGICMRRRRQRGTAPYRPMVNIAALVLVDDFPFTSPLSTTPCA
jgi:hypothetical protein